MDLVSFFWCVEFVFEWLFRNNNVEYHIDDRNRNNHDTRTDHDHYCRMQLPNDDDHYYDDHYWHWHNYNDDYDINNYDSSTHDYDTKSVSMSIPIVLWND